jgi:hypothetical protein
MQPVNAPSRYLIFFPKNTRYLNISPPIACGIIISVAALILFGLYVFSADVPKIKKSGEDLRCYRCIIERVRTGEGYYQAAHSELTSRGYPTGSIFNWRPPLLGWAFGHLPDLRIAKTAAMFLSLFTIWLWVKLAGRELSFRKVASSSLLLLGAPIYSFLPDIYLAHEFWAGILISFSILTYVKGWRWLAYIAGILALLIRELSLPFIAIMLVLSLYDRKYRETFIWASGVAAFFVMMVIHFLHIKELAQPDNIFTFENWLTLGGWRFVLETASMHPYLFLMPAWFTAVLVPLTILGLSGWSGPLGTRIGMTVGIYVLLFLFIGQDFNRYWGVMYVNTFLLGVLYAPGAIYQLFRRVFKSKNFYYGER